MNLDRIYQPIAADLKKVEHFLQVSVKASKNQSIRQMSASLLESGGKRLRPALVILSAKAASAAWKSSCHHGELIRLATAVELIHMASLIHDDVLDGATLRRNKPSINAKLGDDISIVFGDYLYSKAFELIGKCRNPDVFECICQAIHVMCEGELKKDSQRIKNVPILMLTGVKGKTGIDFKSTANDPTWCPVDGFLDKPVEPDVLLAEVRKLLQK